MITASGDPAPGVPDRPGVDDARPVALPSTSVMASADRRVDGEVVDRAGLDGLLLQGRVVAAVGLERP